MNREEQLEWEARWSRPAAAAAAAAIVLPILAGVYQTSSLESRPTAGRTAELLRLIDRQPEVFLIGGLIQALGILVIAGVLAYLYRVVKYRRPALPSAAIILGILGPVLLAVAAVLDVLDRFDNANQFLGTGAETERRADDLYVERSNFTLGIGVAGTLALSFGLIATNLAAIRAGVVSRFLGIIGVIVGALYIVGQVVSAAAPIIIQLFWLGAIAALFLNRWPGGRGPAWAAGEAIPWPSAADQAKAREAARQGAQPESEEPSAPKPSRKKRRGR